MNARLVTPDVLASALVAAALWVSVRLWRSPPWHAHLVAGAVVGLATSATCNAALVGVTVLVAAVTADDGARVGVRALPP